MKKTFLFPTCFRKIGWIISIVTLLYFVIGVIFFADKFDFNFKMPAIVGLEKIYNLIPEKDYFVLAKTSFTFSCITPPSLSSWYQELLKDINSPKGIKKRY